MPASHEIEHKATNGIGQVTCKEGKPPLWIVTKVRLAEAIARVRNRIGQGRHGVDDLNWKWALGLKLLADIVLHHLTQGHEIRQRRLLRNMLADIRLVEPFQTCIAQSRCTIVVVCINGTVNILEAVVQLLGVPEVNRDHGRGYRLATTEDDVPNVVGRCFVVRLNVVYEHPVNTEPLLFW